MTRCHPRPRFRPRLEALETRLAPATTEWIVDDGSADRVEPEP